MIKNTAISLAVLLGFSVAGTYGAEVPRKAPELIVALPGGTSVNLASYRGKVVTLAFISST